MLPSLDRHGRGISQLKRFYAGRLSPEAPLKLDFSLISPSPKNPKTRFASATKDARIQTLTAIRRSSSSTLAPPLLSCDRSIFGNFTMVVMNYVDGKQLFQKYPYESPGEVLNNVSEALKVLHANNLAFCDLRLPNALVTDQCHVQLVDFSWCGQARERGYPVSVNLVDIEWPEGVAPEIVTEGVKRCSPTLYQSSVDYSHEYKNFGVS
ncbi:hypothetical protein BDM02DRAFT_3270442 [Thelephora ganbajun]|uniref:Uncharacterized protein n=1 Tax=Thelephora ganbajun TaxID=370292 RepID=A0ACB6ZC65_THEGA|nr:hypothetical protein BDM02DRAFT_3270442 [Thelephora ganbajun]